MNRALITGITGQDGSYLAEFLLGKGYEVHGIVRRHSTISTERIDHIFPQLHLHYGDLTDGSGLARILTEIEPNEVYNLAAQSHVKVSFDSPEYSVDVGATGTTRLLEAIRLVGLEHSVRFYQASSSEMFGGLECPATGFNERSPFHPRSPYACAKVYSYWQTVNYREAYSMHASNGILFNHESPRRGPTFVTQKIVQGLARIRMGLQEKLVLGNMLAFRDWGHARDYVKAMWLMLQQSNPDDYVIATGETNTVLRFLTDAGKVMGFEKEDLDKIVDTDPRYKRPAEVPYLLGDSTKAKAALGWKPEVSFKQLVEEMALEALKAAGREKRLAARVVLA